MKKLLFALAFSAVAALGIGTSFAQAPQVSSVNADDLVQVIPHGNVSAGNVYATLSELLGGGNALQVYASYTNISATPGMVRTIRGEMSLDSSLTLTSGNLVGVRGNTTVPSGATAGTSAYIYGAQGKLTGGGTFASGLNAAGLVAQWDFSTGTYTAGTVSALWIDAGASASSSAQSTSFGGDSHLLRVTNTTNAGAALTSDIIQIYANSNYLLNLGAPADTVSYSAAPGTGTNSCAKSGGAICAKALKVKLSGVDYWLPLYSSNGN